MHRKLPLENPKLYEVIHELSNMSKFRIMELTQNKKRSITLLAKEASLAFNKCSNYCTEMEKHKLITKEKKGKNVFVKSRVNFSQLSSCSLL